MLRPRVGWQDYHVRRLFVLAFCLFVAGCAAQGPIDRAQQLVRMHREGEAITTLRAHLARHPDDVAARRLLVRVYAFSGDLEGAKREVAELERRLPGDPVSWIELGHAFELQHRYDEALAAYDTAASTAPSSPAGPREGGMRCARWGEPEEALPRLEEAVRRGAGDAEIFHALGLVRVHMRDLDGAADAYERGLRADPKSTENLLGLATVAVVRDDAKAALSAYDRILARKPSYAAAELGRAWALAKLGRRDEAKRALDHAEELGAPRENVARQRANLK
ncbi:MAG: tetratricopeptide repeat protein [Labilithrix sp.]|nr:tetratricopeptide repeat protein [Labilithrix sp.]